MNQNDPQAMLNREISITTRAVVVLAAASLFSLCLFVFLVSHDIVRKILGTSVIGFVGFGAFGIVKFRYLMILRRLRAELFAQESANPRWIKLSCRQKKEFRSLGGGVAIPDGATSVTMEYETGIGVQNSRKLSAKFAARFLPALFAQRPQWIALLRQ